ncbi:LOW QUALITY PROTEIN: CCAAT/enhancer-binding protein zeta-like [Menidia menidia]
MAAKNKQRKRSKATRKGEFVTQDFEPEAESGGEGEEEAPGRGGEAPGPGGGGEAGGGEEDQLSLDEVLHLGGTRADFVLLAGLDDSNELVDGGKKGAIDDLEAGELEKFICKLGIRAYAGQQALADDAVTTATDGQEADGGEASGQPLATGVTTATGDQKAISGKSSGERPATKPTKKMAAAVTAATESQKAIEKGGEASGERPATKLTKKMAAAAVTAATKGGESSGERPATKLTKKMAAAAVTAATEDQKDIEKGGEASGKPAKKTRPGPDVFEFRRRQTLLVKPGGKWFAAGCTAEAAAAPQDAALVARYAALAERLLAAEVQLYKTTRKGANAAWMKTVVTAGVLADRMAAMTVLVQDAPVHSLEHVEALVALMRRRGGRRAGLMALETLRELLLSDLLPEGRKLRPLELRPFDLLENRASGNRDARDRRLVLWMFEHRLKEQVAAFVAALGSVASDPVAAARSLSLSAAQQLLVSRPEQERALLALIANKLGAPEPRTAARAAHLLGALLRRHAAMAPAVCAEVERLVLRPGAGPRGAVPRRHLPQPGGAVPRPGAARRPPGGALLLRVPRRRAPEGGADADAGRVLAGVNRAYPYAGAGDPRVREQMGTLFRVAQTADFNTAMQALMLLFQVMDAEQSVSDRYYCSLYRKLLDPGLASSSRQNLFLNLLYKSLKADVAPRRVQAFVRRLLQVCALLGASFACGALFLVSEVLRARPGLRGLLTEDGEEEEEDFRDQEEEEEKEKEEEGPAPPPAPKASWVHHQNASWVHHQNLEGGGSSRSYDPLHRNPLYCGAHRSAFWELQRLALHYHPSVSLFARTLLKGESIQYSGDPLQDFTLIRFLDRFVFRNPKQPRNRGDSAAQRSNQKFSIQLPVNSAEFLSRDESQVPVDQVFFHRYFRKRQQQQQSRRPRRDGDEESLEDVDDEEFERLLDSCEGDSLYADLGDEQLDFAG